jgi:hypothetical protein
VGKAVSLAGSGLQLRALDYLLWVSAPVMLTCALVFMRKRDLAAELPIFHGYLIFQIVTDVLLMAIERTSYAVYYYTYWVVAALGVLFTFALIDELFRVAFRNFTAVRNVGSYIFRWGVLLLLLAAAGSTVGLPHSEGPSGVSTLVLVGDRGARAMLCLLAMLLLLGARYLHIPTSSTLFGIALGFVNYMFAKVVLDSIALRHPSYVSVINRTSSAVYLSSCVLWMLYTRYGSRLPSHPVTAASSFSADERGPLAGRRSLLEALNSMVEESMSKTGKTL